MANYVGLCVGGPLDGRGKDWDAPRFYMAENPLMDLLGPSTVAVETTTISRHVYSHCGLNFVRNGVELLSTGLWVHESLDLAKAWVRLTKSYIDGRKSRDTGVKDMHGRPIMLGDRVRNNNASSYIRPEYLNPEYEVVFDPPSFALKHVGGGLEGGSLPYILKNGGADGYLEVISPA